MSKLQWYFNRLRAMNLPEVGWRLQQKHLQRQEKKLFGKRDVAVTAYLFDSRLQSLKFDSDHVGLNFRNIAFHLNTVIHILGGYDYHIYKERWSAGFQTDKEWGDGFQLFLKL